MNVDSENMMPTLAYLIPEFPGQTHIWMWREIAHLREWGVDIKLHSTRPPKEHERARHRFSQEAANLTQYLSPIRFGEALTAIAWLAFSPIRTLRCVALAARLPVERAGGKRPIPLKLLLPAAILVRRLKREGSTHLHIHTAASGAILGMMVRRLADIPYSLTLNADIGWWGGAMREKFQESAFTIVITQRLLDEIKRDFPALREEQRLLGRIGVDTQQNIPPSVRPSGRQIVTVARLHPSKGHDVLLRAIAMLRDRGVEASLRIAGAGPQKEELESLVSELKLGDRVTFLGSIGDAAVIAELQAADVFVLASHAEPLGVAYMEAMACGVPTIGTSAGGVAEIITTGVDGLLVPPKDPAALADAIARVLEEPQLREQLSVAGRQKIVDRFDSRIGARTLYERLYGKLPVPQ